MRQNIINLMIAWNMFDECSERMKNADRETAMPAMLQTIFILTPVISTTFASAQSFLGEISKSGTLGTLIVDESGQAQPQMAVGALFRCRKAII
jgi:superfamily I DNA and/or RNA helicase